MDKTGPMAGRTSPKVTKDDEGRPNPRFQNYSSVFQNMVKHKSVQTKWYIMSMIITYDSTKAITVTKQNDWTYFVKQYDLETYEMTFEEQIGGDQKQYLKLKEVE
jgi:hypothetical protein